VKNSLAVIVLLTAGMLWSCKPSLPPGIIAKDKIEDILYDYHMAQAMGRLKSGEEADYERMACYHAVLRKHGVTEEQFDSSMVFYYKRIDYLKDIYSRVNERMANEATALGASTGALSQYSQYSEDGDTANVWRMGTTALLIPRPTMNRFDFSITADSTYKKGDAFMLQFNTEWICQNGTKDAVVCVVTKYDGDSIVQTASHVTIAGLAQIRVPSCNTRLLKELKGYIYLNDGGDEQESRKMMFISQIQLIRFHNKQLPEESETERRDSVQTDSLRRADYPAGGAPDTLRRRTVGRQGRYVLPVEERTAPDRVVVRDHQLKR